MWSEGETGIVNLCRSSWAGIQHFSAAFWSGDIQSTFDDFRRQITAGLNAAISGILGWTTDIGGFLHEDVNDPNNSTGDLFIADGYPTF